MFPYGIDPLMEYKRRHQESLKEAAQYRLVQEALKAGRSEDHRAAKILALVGKKLASVGTSLEERYGGQAQIEVRLSRRGNPGGC